MPLEVYFVESIHRHDYIAKDLCSRLLSRITSMSVSTIICLYVFSETLTILAKFVTGFL